MALVHIRPPSKHDLWYYIPKDGSRQDFPLGRKKAAFLWDAKRLRLAAQPSFV
jgi:hypothetical protein